MAPPVLSQRALNRALLERQLLLERSSLSITDAIEQVGGLQTQYAPSGYVGLWTRLRDFRRDDLTRALEDRSVVQATLLRGTIHMVSRADFWPYAEAIRRSRQEWAARAAVMPPAAELRAKADALRQALANGPRTVKELGEMGRGFVGNLGLWVDIVRVPPSGTWERRRADRLALAEAWIGTAGVTETEGLTHIVRAYLRGFAPASWRDVASWAGISVQDAKRAGEALELKVYRDDAGKELFDLAGLSIPDEREPAPVRFLPHWDNNLLVHARRTGILPEAHRGKVFSTKNPFSVGVALVDGRAVAGWTPREGRIELEPYEELSPKDARAVEREREALEAFHA
ncbi:MAG TPA: winged helix DNA-binding domain-containing protein [Candidatus Polarisedimenticolia bacterium]|nr:winged helix DNA-binding domain-containing protein [Candidatus Polarisedimenticolia bacterium]